MYNRIMDQEKNLTPLQELWLEHFIQNGLKDGTDAARKAGYKGTDEVLRSRAYKNINHPAIKARIRERIEAVGISSDQILQELAQIALASVGDVAKVEGGQLVLDGEAVLVRGHLIESIRTSESTSQHGGSVAMSIKMQPRIKALELLGRHLELWKGPEAEVNVNISQEAQDGPHSDEELFIMLKAIIDQKEAQDDQPDQSDPS